MARLFIPVVYGPLFMLFMAPVVYGLRAQWAASMISDSAHALRKAPGRATQSLLATQSLRPTTPACQTSAKHAAEGGTLKAQRGREEGQTTLTTQGSMGGFHGF
jgi:guanyl-specific ribonuclease Sa